MSILSPATRACSVKLGFTRFNGTHRISRFEARCDSFSFEVTIGPAVVGCVKKSCRPRDSSSKLHWRGCLSRSSSFDPLMYGSTVQTPHAAGLPGATNLDLEDSSDESQNGASSPQLSDQLLIGSELAALRSDPVRSRLIRKLSEANQYNRYLLREVQEREKLIQRCKSQISSLEVELGVLVNIAQEIAKDGGKPGTRKINGRYIHSHLACRLEDVHKTLLAQIKDIEGEQSREIDFVWNGMAEDVTVMGSFDDWSQGEPMSPESTGTFTRFSVTLKLRPGRYEIKFQVDGDWRLSPELPTIGEGLMMNNLLIVE